MDENFLLMNWGRKKKKKWQNKFLIWEKAEAIVGRKEVLGLNTTFVLMQDQKGLFAR